MRLDGSAGGLRWKSLAAFDPLLPIGIGLDQARIDCKSFTADQAALLDAAPQDALKHSTEEIVLPKALTDRTLQPPFLRKSDVTTRVSRSKPSQPIRHFASSSSVWPPLQ
jgi:hypothetical protein